MSCDEEANLDDLIELSCLSEEERNVSVSNDFTEKSRSGVDNTDGNVSPSTESIDIQPDELDLESLAEHFFVIQESNSACQTTNKPEESSQPSNDKQNKLPDLKASKVARILKDISIDTLFNKSIESDALNNGASSLIHRGDSSEDEADENKIQLSVNGEMIKEKIAVRKSYDERQRLVIKTWKDKENPAGASRKNVNKNESNYMIEEFSGLRIINPAVSRDFLKERMAGRRLIKMSNISNCLKNGDVEGDWVTIGVVVNKLPPKTSKNGKTYSIWKMVDRLDSEIYTSVFFFGKAHSDHWKTAIGTVLGILNPSILPEQESFKSSSVSISIDHPGKVLMFGSSKDLGTCKGISKNGAACTAVVDKSKCEYCIYHISKVYKKFSSQRTEFHGFSKLGKQPDFKSRVLKGQNFMYGGQMFSTPTSSLCGKKTRVSKDKFILSSLNPLKRKADILDLEERNKRPNKLASPSTSAVENVKSAESKFIDERLSLLTPGSRNLSQHLVNAEKKKKVESKKFVSVTPKELLKLHEKQLKTKQGTSSVDQGVRKIGLGFKPGDEICLDMKPNLKNHLVSRTSELAKFKAIQKIKEKGPLKPKNPNAVKVNLSPEFQDKVKKCLDNNADSTKETVVTKQEVNSALGWRDISSDKIKKILAKKSSHSQELEDMDNENHELYFNTLEKKENMEEKMMATKEMICSVVSCRVCNYTAHQATDLCKNEQHPLRFHKATKRFFSCTSCKRRTFCFTKLPKRACRGCGGSSFEKTGMMKARSGPKLDSEILLIRGEERKYINS